MTRILLVDDNKSLRGVMARWLRAQGAKVTEAATVIAADALLSEERFDAVVADLTLADGPTGERILESARTRQPHAIRIVASASSEAETAPLLQSGFAQVVLRKPFPMRELALRLGLVANAA